MQAIRKTCGMVKQIGRYDRGRSLTFAKSPDWAVSEGRQKQGDSRPDRVANKSRAAPVDNTLCEWGVLYGGALWRVAVSPCSVGGAGREGQG